MKQYTIENLREQFKEYHPLIKDVLRASETDNMIWNDIIDHKPVSRYAYGKVLLIGDAAHATTPNMGQGACQAIEDAVVLAIEMSQNADIEQAFMNFEKRRIKRTHDIVNTSRVIGRMAQTNNKLLAFIRNILMSSLPASFNKRQLKKLYEVDF